MAKRKSPETINAEIRARLKKYDEETSVLGTELRNRRIALSRTLCAISYQICSISYLSKVEHNKIMPSSDYINEFSERLSLSNESVDLLLKSKDILMDSVLAFLNNDMDMLEKIYHECEGLTNYRMQLVRLVVEVSLQRFYEANKIVKKLMKLLTSMSELDLYVFSLFKSIIHYNFYEFKEALDGLETLKNCRLTETMSIIRDKYIFLSSQAINSFECKEDFNKLVFKLTEVGRYDEIEYVRYVMCMFLIKNDLYRDYERIKKGIHSSLLVYSLDIMYSFYNGEDIDFKNLEDDKINNFIIALKAIYTGNPDADLIIGSISDLCYEPGNDYLLLKYLNISDANKKYTFIIEEALPRLEVTYEGYLIKYFLNELSVLCQAEGKYKAFSDAYRKFYEMKVI